MKLGDYTKMFTHEDPNYQHKRGPYYIYGYSCAFGEVFLELIYAPSLGEAVYYAKKKFPTWDYIHEGPRRIKR